MRVKTFALILRLYCKRRQSAGEIGNIELTKVSTWRSKDAWSDVAKSRLRCGVLIRSNLIYYLPLSRVLLGVERVTQASRSLNHCFIVNNDLRKHSSGICEARQRGSNDHQARFLLHWQGVSEQCLRPWRDRQHRSVAAPHPPESIVPSCQDSLNRALSHCFQQKHNISLISSVFG